MVHMPNHLLHNDLYIEAYGKEQALSNEIQDIETDNYYSIYYITDGKGIITIGNQQFNLGKGQGFLAKPHIDIQMQADSTEPWAYCWIEFYGIQSENIIQTTNLTESYPVFSYNYFADDFQQFIHFAYHEPKTKTKYSTSTDLKLLGILYFLLSTLIESNPNNRIAKRQIKKEEYVSKVIDYIDSNYGEKITVAKIAEHVGLDRSYLSSLFKNYLNVSIQEYLIQFRVNKACTFLHSSDWPIGHIAKLVGYEDPLLFSKMFKKYKGISPSHYRNKVEH